MPEGAGEKIAQGIAKLQNDQYIEKGAFVVSNGLLGVVSKDLKVLTLSTEGVRVGYPHNMGISEDSTVILPDDSEYIYYMNQAAKIEDKLFATNSLKEPLFSEIVPRVVEYRDDDIVPTWKINQSIVDQHERLINSPIPYVLPVFTLNTGTNLARALLSDYAKAGIEIDLEEGEFKLAPDSKVYLLRVKLVVIRILKPLLMH